jgi:glutaredoxin
MLLETFKNLNPHVRSVPYITYGNRVIGGFNELSKVINEQLSNVNKTQILNEGNTNAF